MGVVLELAEEVHLQLLLLGREPEQEEGLKTIVSITRRTPDLYLRSKVCGKYKERLYLYSSMEDLQDLSVVTPLLVAMVRQLMNIPCPSLAGVSGTSRDRLML